MPATSTPNTRRETRSGSQTSALLTEIKALIESSKNEVITSLTDEIKTLKDTIQNLSKRVVDLEQKYSCLKGEQKEMEERVVHECTQRRRREKNVVVFGLREAVTGSAIQRNEHDLVIADKLVNDLDLPDLEIKSARRLGKSSNNKRPLLLTLENLEQKLTLLRKSPLLKRMSAYNIVFVDHDLTPLQQKKKRALLEELQDRRKNGENVVIFRNRIIAKQSPNDIQNFQ